MKRATLTLVTAVILAAASAVLTPTAASAASGALAGTWTSIDNDGSTQTLDITGSGRHAYSMVYVDESATSACDGNPAQVSGPGYVEGEDLVMVGSLVCLPGGNDLRTRITLFFDYDAGADTLTDSFGIVWERAS
jgi:hypothetical protein